MSRYKAYTEYKDSGVEWLGEIPTHWGSRQLKYLASYNDEVISESTPSDYEIEYVDIGSVSANDGISQTETMLFCNAPSRARRIVRHGDVIISTVRTYLEAIAPIVAPPENLIASTGFAVIRPNKSLDKNFAAYSLRASGFIKEVVARSVGVSYPAINASDLVNVKAPEPSLIEQEKIAAFLDHETAKIDALIEKQQRLIELLKEKRQAVISHAVTKGLNPNAPMKDSGVEWLGEVPAHWLVAPLKRFSEVIDCKHYTVQFLDEGLPIVSIRELRDDLIDISNAKLTSQAEWDFLREGRVPQIGDIVFCRNASVGAAGYVSDKFEFCMGQDVCLIRTGKSNRYMHFQITSRHVREQIEAFLVGATIRRANVEEIRGLVVAQPPENEQIEIANYLEFRLSEFNELAERANQTVELLTERRSALISAAVTGKIDVRDWQPAAA